MRIRNPAQVAEAEAKLASILERLAQKVIPNLEVRASEDGRRFRDAPLKTVGKRISTVIPHGADPLPPSSMCSQDR
jgi:hypothetical protein